jgi:hydroxymethylbilane synthase
LARRQAEEIAEGLCVLGVEVVVTPLRTEGDRRQDALSAFGGQGVFTREIQQALLEDRIDLAVHSLKDLPTEGPPELAIVAVPERAPCGDVLITEKATGLEDLPPGGRLGTGSVRRRAQLLHVRPDLQTVDVRGNLDTRLRKLREGQFDALVLAEAGLIRLGLADQITQRLPLSEFLPAVGQGALALEIRSDDAETRQVLAALDHPPTHAAVLAERAMLATLQAGCLAPVAAWGRMEGDRLRLTARVLTADGREKIETDRSAPPSEPAALGRRTAEVLLNQGAAQMIRQH